ncbi:TetR family transcriptional regulator [Cryptosporangium sp. NPDC048952]|uniref:TetR family transcriptional regulator n=1 Tax=Cryptosporangium sp. NPDC048952 TaxID=3363961 RepID=UPI003720EF83
MLDAEAILAATEDVLRRYGPAKATVVDVARALDVSHAAVYRHFPSKAALREAVIRRWLGRGLEHLVGIAEDPRVPPPARLRAWLVAMSAAKQAKVREEPELFATYKRLAEEHSEVAAEFAGGLIAQLRTIVDDGIASGDFSARDGAATTRTVFEATALFHYPAFAEAWLADDINARLEAVCDVLLDGLRAR